MRNLRHLYSSFLFFLYYSIYLLYFLISGWCISYTHTLLFYSFSYSSDISRLFITISTFGQLSSPYLLNSFFSSPSPMHEGFMLPWNHFAISSILFHKAKYLSRMEASIYIFHTSPLWIFSQLGWKIHCSQFQSP